MTLLFTLYVLLAASTIEDEKKGSDYGYGLKSLTELGQKELHALVEELVRDDKHHLFEAALKLYPVSKVDASVGDDEPVAPEYSDSFEDSISVVSLNDDEGTLGRRELAGLPDKHGWANTDTRHCANEGGWCACTGNVVYTKKCAGTFSCNQANWNTVVSKRWNSNHKADVSGGVRCDNGNFGGDPWPGHDKQCFCHPVQTNCGAFSDFQQVCGDTATDGHGFTNTVAQKSGVTTESSCAAFCEEQGPGCCEWREPTVGRHDGWCMFKRDAIQRYSYWHKTSKVSICHEGFDRYDYIEKWTEQACHDKCGDPSRSGWWNDDWWKGFWCGFYCTGGCTVQALGFVAGRVHKYPIEDCAEHCYCVAKGWTG